MLGCGGLVARKRRAGVPVTVVFMTDGAASHAGAVEREELAARRRREALAACDVLGVPADSVHFLDIPDGCLADSTGEALAQLETILGSVGARQLVAPHPHEPPADHVATYDVAQRWAAGGEVGAEMMLYPVWLWDQWPYTNPLSGPRRGSVRSIVRTGLTQGGGLGLGRLLDHRLDIGDVLPVKRAALAEHASQTVRPPDRPDWPTLGDVAGGDWIDLLLRPVELYALRTPGGWRDDRSVNGAAAGRAVGANEYDPRR